MFFTDREKQIYQPPGSDAKFDPLALDRRLVVETGGRLNDLIADYNALGDAQRDAATAADTGVPPPSPDELREAEVTTARATLQLAPVARKVFSLPAFPDCTDGTALEMLFDFLGWLEKKD